MAVAAFIAISLWACKVDSVSRSDQDAEFVAQYGYGITTLPPTQAFGAGEQNTRIYDQLSAADQIAYKRTLWGDNVEATFVIMLENEDFSGAGGCTKKAIHQVYTEEQRNANY